jgi:Flp pilus assembly CpaE family ATPase
MKKIILLLLLPTLGTAQKIRVVQSCNDADVRVYETTNHNDADLLVYKVGHNEAKGNRGLWRLSVSEGDIKVCFTRSHNDAEVLIYFTDRESEAGWRNCAKKRYFAGGKK